MSLGKKPRRRITILRLLKVHLRMAKKIDLLPDYTPSVNTTIYRNLPQKISRPFVFNSNLGLQPPSPKKDPKIWAKGKKSSLLCVGGGWQNKTFPSGKRL